MSHRYYCAVDPEKVLTVGEEHPLDEKESHHALHVMRVKPGDPIELFDGCGNEFEATIVATQRKQVTVQITAQHAVSRELSHPLIVAIPIPKADRQKFLVEKLTELGVTRLLFIDTERSSVQCNEKTISKLARLVIESSKQCRRNHLMEISFGGNLPELARSMQSDSYQGYIKRFAHPAMSDPSLPHNPCPSVILIGPEGGLSGEEVDLLQQLDWECLDLGQTILRMETAAVAATVLLRN